eukprot:m.211413 g.211413  ORF g.211413 m.211413 type:complete len:97 (-) comp16942_c0_seq39:927-1217(-)
MEMMPIKSCLTSALFVTLLLNATVHIILSIIYLNFRIDHIYRGGLTFICANASTAASSFSSRNGSGCEHHQLQQITPIISNFEQPKSNEKKQLPAL